MSTVPVPAPAAAAGYNTLALGPNVTLGSNWNKATAYGINPSAVDATQNGDGSVTIAGGGDGYNLQLESTKAFGGGGYFVATFSWTGGYSQNGGWPSFWANDQHMTNPNCCSQWYEVDGVEYWAQNMYGSAFHNWLGSGGENSQTVPQFNLPGGADPSQPHKYGFLWKPATATSQGSMTYYFDDQPQPGGTITWSQGDPRYGAFDSHQITLLLGTGPNNPQTVTSVEVWQASCAKDTGQ